MDLSDPSIPFADEDSADESADYVGGAKTGSITDTVPAAAQGHCEDARDVVITATSQQQVNTPSPSKDVEQVEKSVPSKDMEQVETPVSSKDMEQVDTPISSKDTEQMETPTPSNDTEQMETASTPRDTEQVETTPTPKDAEQVETSIPSKDMEQAEAPLLSENMEQVETSASLQNVEPSEHPAETVETVSSDTPGDASQEPIVTCPDNMNQKSSEDADEKIENLGDDEDTTSEKSDNVSDRVGDPESVTLNEGQGQKELLAPEVSETVEVCPVSQEASIIMGGDTVVLEEGVLVSFPQGAPAELPTPADGDETQALSAQWTPPQQNEPLLNQENTATVAEKTKLIESEEGSEETPSAMDEQGETHGGAVETSRADEVLDDFFSSPSQPVVNGHADDTVDCTLRIDEPDAITEKGDASTRPRLDKESSPEIIVGSLDSVENVTLKDATSEKELLGNGDADGVSVQKDSLGSRSDEDKRKSSSDMDMDFAVLELDSSHLNLDASKQRSSLRKRGSLARRKKPSRGSINNLSSGSPDSIYQDSTDAKPVTSPTSDTAEDDVFDKQSTTAPSQQTGTSSSESITVRKAAQPFKPSVIMPGLQDLSKSKLFNQERKKSGELPSSPIKSPLTSPLSPTIRPAPPTVLPKPATKGQKESQNKTIAAENSSLDNMASSGDSDGTVTASVQEELVVTSSADSASSLEGPKSAQSESEPLSGPRHGHTDSWSSVSSPRRLSRGDSVSSVEGGEGGSSSTTPRRASIQGSAYAPIGFRPRRSSSIVLDSSNKLIENPVLSSSSSSTTTTTLEQDSEAVMSTGVKSPTYKAPVWLSEMKAKTGITSGDSSVRLRSTSNGSSEGNSVPVSSPRSRNNSESTGSVEGISTEGDSKKQDPDKPSWLKSSQGMPGKEQSKKEEQENGDEEEEKQPTPPWAADLKKRSRPVVTARISTVMEGGNGTVFPFKNSSSNNKESEPVVNSSRDEYSPSWMKSTRQVKKPPVPLPKTAGKPAVTNGSKAAVDSTSENRMRAYETPKWKLELAEKKKKREAEMLPTVDSEVELRSSTTGPSTNTDSSASSSADIPQWKQQLSQRKRRSVSEAVKEMDAEAASGSSCADFAKQAEERRSRLIKAGLLDQAEASEES